MRRTFYLVVILIITVIACKKTGNGVKTTPPDPPGNLIVKALSATTVNLSWSDNSTNETGFKIERKRGAETYKEIHTTANNIQTFNDTGLLTNTIYKYRVFAFNSAGRSITSSDEVTVTTDNVKQAPTIETKSVSSITINTAISGGNVISDGGAPIISKGLVWSTSQNPTTSLSTKSSDSTSSATFTNRMDGLTNNTTYYVRAYAINSIGTGYGEEISFKTSTFILPATSDTISITSITSNSAIAWIGPLVSDGGTLIISRGVVWSTNQNPTISLTTKRSDTARGWIEFSITGLTPSVKYYIREYATNSVGTSYGKEISFTVGTTASIPVITTKRIDTIYRTSAIGGGLISDNGGAPVFQRGVCWNTVPNPTVSLTTRTSDGTGNGDFRSNIIGLIANTNYYVRAYATNSAGTAYGNEIAITTEPIAKPMMSTFSVNGVHPDGISSTPINYTSGGAFYDDGGATINQKGVCWDINQNPTISLSTKSSDGSGTGSFSSSITGLMPNKTYYIRSYATNSAGTGYGTQLTFTTSIPPIGQAYKGGVIAYIFQPDDFGYIAGETHGLIAAPTDQSGPVPWSPNYNYFYTGAASSILGMGQSNTDRIVEKYGTGRYAAKICDDLVLNGYSDWYLPSHDELNKLFLNRFAIGNFEDQNEYYGKFYWTSTDNGYTQSQNFYTGKFSDLGTNWNSYVRAIRSF